MNSVQAVNLCQAVNFAVNVGLIIFKFWINNLCQLLSFWRIISLHGNDFVETKSWSYFLNFTLMYCTVIGFLSLLLLLVFIIIVIVIIMFFHWRWKIIINNNNVAREILLSKASSFSIKYLCWLHTNSYILGGWSWVIYIFGVIWVICFIM